MRPPGQWERSPPRSVPAGCGATQRGAAWWGRLDAGGGEWPGNERSSPRRPPHPPRSPPAQRNCSALLGPGPARRPGESAVRCGRRGAARCGAVRRAVRSDCACADQREYRQAGRAGQQGTKGFRITICTSLHARPAQQMTHTAIRLSQTNNICLTARRARSIQRTTRWRTTCSGLHEVSPSHEDSTPRSRDSTMCPSLAIRCPW